MSLANHSTFDSGIKNSDKYFLKILDLIEKNGILILESHHPDYENLEKFTNVFESIVDRFVLIDEGFYNTKNYYDNKRKYLILKSKI